MHKYYWISVYFTEPMSRLAHSNKPSHPTEYQRNRFHTVVLCKLMLTNTGFSQISDKHRHHNSHSANALELQYLLITCLNYTKYKFQVLQYLKFQIFTVIHNKIKYYTYPDSRVVLLVSMQLATSIL